MKFFIDFFLNRIRSTPDMFSFLMSDHRAPPPDTDQEALEIALLQAEFQGNNQYENRPHHYHIAIIILQHSYI